MSEHCEFRDGLDNILRDRLVCGLRDMKMQRRLLAEGKLTFMKAFELAQVAELMDKNVADLQRPQTPEVVHARLPSYPEFLLQFMEDIDSDLSNDDFDGYIDDNVVDESVRPFILTQRALTKLKRSQEFEKVNIATAKVPQSVME
ncbi:hypothetical protein EMCRGX_G033154 [Ephydatia muelleri]